MVIAGIVVQLHPQDEAAALAAVQTLPGVRYEGTPTPGHAVIVLEADDDRTAEASLKALSEVPGVLGVYPAYIHSEV
ncbi:MAG: NapD protein [Symbiobacteriaceae bacterium]|jgi:nitrate reductase NapAB chaperone NapD|nr:NapD protein [Symbiobacteriaceae bacterium]